MLRGTQTVYSKNKDKSIRYHEVVPAVYFDFGPDDATEEISNEVQDEVSKKASVKMRTVPKYFDADSKEIKSQYDDELLLTDMLNYFTETYGKDKAIHTVLQRVTDGENAVLKENARPAKEIDEAAAIEKQAVALVKLKKGKITLEAAREKIKAMLAD